MKKQRESFIFFSVALLLCCSVILSLSKEAFAFTLPDTGQTKCYNTSGTEISCSGTGQDGTYNINPMSYTDNGNGTITDNVTGLIWQKGENSTYYNWYQASGTYDATYNSSSQSVCGSLTLGGQSGWRLPAKKELITLVDYSIPYPGPTINTTISRIHMRTAIGRLPPTPSTRTTRGTCTSAMATSTTTISPTTIMSGASGADSRLFDNLGSYDVCNKADRAGCLWCPSAKRPESRHV